jgi:hypothetical protein
LKQPNQQQKTEILHTKEKTTFTGPKSKGGMVIIVAIAAATKSRDRVKKNAFWQSSYSDL